MLEEDRIVQVLVPHGTIRQVVPIIAEELLALLHGFRGLDAEDAAEPGVGKVGEPAVGEEAVVDLVGEGGRVGLDGAVLRGNVEDLLLLLVQSDLVRVVVPVVERLKKEQG